MKHYPFLIILLLLMSGCGRNNKKFKLIRAFPQPVKLKGEQVFEDEKGILVISQIDSLIIISTMQDTLIHIYDKKENLIARLGIRGRGPGEFNTPPFIRDAIKVDSTIKIFYHNNQLNTYVSINVTASLDSNKVIIGKIYKLPGQLVGTTRAFYIDSSTIAGMYDDQFYQQLDGRRGGFYYYTKSDTFETFSLYNLKIKPLEVLPATNVNARTSAISPDHSKLAFVMSNSPKLEIFQVGSTKPHRFLLDSNPPKDIFDLKTFKERENIEYYRYVDVTNNYIYLLYSGFRHNERDEAHQTRIQVLDWEGNPQAQYLIPAKYNLVTFIVDEKNKMFYGVSYINDAIYKFDFGTKQ